MDLIKKIHSDVLSNRIDPKANKDQQHGFQTGIHAAAAAVARYKDTVLVPITVEELQVIQTHEYKGEPKTLGDMVYDTWVEGYMPNAPGNYGSMEGHPIHPAERFGLESILGALDKAGFMIVKKP